MVRSSAALALASLFASRTVMAEPCAPRAELDGDRAAIERVAAELVRLGVMIAPPSATCPSVHAMVALDDHGGIAVAVRGAQATGRSEGRVLSDATLAAAWIDSWARDDLDVASWAGAPEPVVAAPASAPSGARPIVAPGDVPPTAPSAAPPSLLSTASIAASYELAWTNDSSSWTGVGAAGCVRVGALCIGARIHAAFQPKIAASSTAAARSDLSALATVSAPLALGETVVAPELGLGLGRLSTRRLDGCVMSPPTCDVMTDPNCPVGPTPPTMCTTDPAGGPPDGTVYVGDGFDHATYTPRLSVALRIAVPLFSHVWLDGFAAATYAPLGHSAAFEPAQTPNVPVPAMDVALPGEPDRSYQVGIGLRIGAAR